MAFLLKKVIRPWHVTKDTSHLSAPEIPVSPPSPDLSHLTPDEISVINEVIRRQEEFERQEADRVKKLREELDSLQQQLTQTSEVRNDNNKLVDLRLCRLCFKTKFADGVGRVCHDCQQRVCQGCGAFSKPRWNARKNKTVRGRWRCKLCIARREVLCRTGGWYHSTPDPTEELKKKLSVVADPDIEMGARQRIRPSGIMRRVDSECNPSGNRTDSELVWVVDHKLPRKVMKKFTRRRSLPAEAGGKDEIIDEQPSFENGDLDDDDDDDKDGKQCLNNLILERRLSRRKRQEKRQRRRIREGQENISSESLAERSRSLSAEDPVAPTVEMGGQHGRGLRRDSVTRSLWGPSSSLNSCIRKPPVIEENTVDTSNSADTESSIFSSFHDSSMSDDFPVSPSPTMASSLKIVRQDAVSLNSSCVSISSTSESRLSEKSKSNMSSSQLVNDKSNDSPRTHSPMGQEVKTLAAKSEDKHSPQSAGERSLQKWKQNGFPYACLISFSCQSKEIQSGLKVTGGVQDNSGYTRAVVTYVSPDFRNRINVGQEVLEWNGQVVRGQTFDFVSAVTTCIYPQTVLIVNPATDSKDSQPLSECSLVITPDLPSSQSPDLQSKGGKRRMLPRTPIEIKRGSRQTIGEIQIKLFYHPSRSTLAITVLKAKNIATVTNTESLNPSPFVVISLVPGKSSHDSLETELKTSTSHPEWEQTFLLDSISLTELASKALQLTVWSYEDGCDIFIGEVLLDLAQAQLDNQPQWYTLEEHDENSAQLPHRRRSHSASMSASWTSGSSALVSPSVSPEVPSHRHHIHRYSPSSAGSTSVSPVPFGNSHVGSREFHLNNVSQPDSFTTKVRKKMRHTVSKMSSLSLSDRKDNAGLDEGSNNEILRRLSDKSDRSVSLSKSPKLQMRAQSSHHSMDLLAPPQPLSRTNSTSSFFLSDDDIDSQGRYSVSPLTPDRPPPDGDDITSILGPGQIPPKPSAETTVCGDIKLGFMVSKGQLEVDIVCAAGLHRAGSIHPPDTYVKTYLVEGKKVIQRKKTLVVKGSFDPVYRKKIRYSACNVHGRTMKIDIWERTGSFEKKACRGEVLVRLDGLDLSKHTMAWYKLFQMNSTDYGSDEFLNSW